MANFVWTDQQITFGVRDFDEEHQELVNLLNDLCVAIDGDDAEKTRKVYDAFRDCMADHFNHEEQVMRDSGYPEFETHCSEHANLLREMDETSQHLDRVRDKALDMFLINHLSYVLLGHILTTDARYMPHFREMGIA
ncbi:MAG: hemerythrin family protein [Hyphomicrobiales bacterium]|nr:hemerythrin family protein [Hyphomicrobiales bacterium]